MKRYAMPLLAAIDANSHPLSDAERLMRMLKYFLDLDDRWVPSIP
jgi:hypothetical protein